MCNKFFIFVICQVLLAHVCFVSAESQSAMSGIKWLTSYDEAIKQAKASGKPVLIVFTGSDWCTWCNKLEKEALNTSDFANTVDSKFVFLRLDFPLYSAQDPKVKAYNTQIQKNLGVRSFPTVIVFDAQQNQKIGSAGYQPGGGRAYGEHLLKMLQNYSSYKQKITVLDKSQFSGDNLKQLYETAKELHLNQDINAIITRGMSSDASLFFSIERYRLLANEGQIHSRDAQTLRQQLLAAFPNDCMHISYQLAVIEFETYCEEVEKENYAPEMAVAPLIAYIEKFGQQDKDNLWRLQMIISQVYLDKNQMIHALKYAQASYESAPPTAQSEIAKAIRNIRSQTHSSLATSMLDK